MLDLRSRNDLQKLIDEALAESLTLDYKASPALNKSNDGRAELVKDVTAFANSAGGQIVYGIPEKKGIPQPLDDGVNCDQISPEWIEQVIDTNSSPRVQKMKVTKIQLDASRPNMVAYVITIAPSTALAPHQNALDKKYYRRFELRSVPMHDYEIRDLLRRGQTPELAARLTFADGTLSRPHRSPQDMIEINTIMENLSTEPCLYGAFEFYSDKRLPIVETAGFKKLKDVTVQGYELQKLQKTFMVPNDFPLLKGSNITVGPPLITLTIPT